MSPAASVPIAVSVKAAAEMLDICPEMIRAAINRGDLPAKRIPPRRKGAAATAIRIDVADIRAWFAELEDVRS